MGTLHWTMGTINTATLVLVHTLLGLVNTVDFEERSLGPISSPDVECGSWTRNTVLISPGTVSTITSQLVKIKKCSVFFKLAGKCKLMKMACSNFNVPKGRDRWFSLSPPGKRYTNGKRPRNWKSSRTLRLVYKGKKCNPLKCRVSCIKSWIFIY